MKKALKILAEDRALYLGVLIISLTGGSLLHDWLFGSEILDFFIFRWVLLILSIILTLFIVYDYL